MDNTILLRIKKTFKKDGLKGFLFKLIKNTIRIICVPINKLSINFFRLLPIKENYIILESQGDFTDNVKVFYDYLITNSYNKKYKLIWFVHNPKEYKKIENVRFISRFHNGIHIRANYYIGVSKFFVFSHPYWLENWRNNQIVINTTHSVAQLKNSSEFQKKKIFDYVLCCSEYCSQIKQKVFEITQDKTLILGMPRIDLIYKHSECITKLVDNYSGQKIALLMETFKQSKVWNDSTRKQNYAINVIKNIKELEKLDEFLYENNTILIVKIHQLQDISFLKTKKLDNIIYLTDKDLARVNIQSNQLLKNSDLLLTDYSSVFYEYLILDRPIGFLIGDIKEYERGFLMSDPLAEMPGKKIKTVEELKLFIKNPYKDQEVYSKQREIIRKKVFLFEDNKNCQRLMDWIEKQ